MSAFVVHDLKNLVAQLSLLLDNAERHRQNPRFQSDMLSTVRHVTDRMNKLLAQLREERGEASTTKPISSSCATMGTMSQAAGSPASHDGSSRPA